MPPKDDDGLIQGSVGPVTISQENRNEAVFVTLQFPGQPNEGQLHHDIEVALRQKYPDFKFA